MMKSCMCGEECGEGYEGVWPMRYGCFMEYGAMECGGSLSQAKLGGALGTEGIETVWEMVYGGLQGELGEGMW